MKDDNKLNEHNDSPQSFSKESIINETHKNFSDGFLESSFQNSECSLYNFVSPTVKTMLDELGLRPPTNIQIIENDNISESCKELALETNNNKPFTPFVVQKLADVLKEHEPSDPPDIKKLKEQLEREVIRRQHCEKIIDDLQQKLLQSEQEISYISAQGIKKDLLIVDLKKVLEQLGSSWQTSDQNRREALEKVTQEKKKLQDDLANSQQVTKDLQFNLENAQAECSRLAESHSLEQKRMHQELAKTQEEKLKLEDQLLESNAAMAKLQALLERHRSECVELQGELQKSRRELHNSELTREQIQADNLKLALNNKQLQECLGESRRHLESLSKEKTSLLEQVHHLSQEKDVLIREFRRAESERLDQELKHQTLIKAKTLEWEDKAKEMINEHEEKMKAGHQLNVENLAKRHQEDMDTMRKTLEQERNRILTSLHGSQSKCQDLEAKLEKTTSILRMIESRRSQLLSHLHDSLQAVWQHAFQIFYGQDAESFNNSHPASLSLCLTERALSLPASPTKKDDKYKEEIPTRDFETDQDFCEEPAASCQPAATRSSPLTPRRQARQNELSSYIKKLLSQAQCDT